mgnify:CR=1 FL=1
MISWGVAWANANIVSRYFDFYDLVFLRFLFGSISLLPFLLYSKENVPLKLEHIKYIVPASIMFLLYNISFFMGTHYGDAGKGAVFATLISYFIVAYVSLGFFKKTRGNFWTVTCSLNPYAAFRRVFQ